MNRLGDVIAVVAAVSLFGSPAGATNVCTAVSDLSNVMIDYKEAGAFPSGCKYAGELPEYGAYCVLDVPFMGYKKCTMYIGPAGVQRVDCDSSFTITDAQHKSDFIEGEQFYLGAVTGMVARCQRGSIDQADGLEVAKRDFQGISAMISYQFGGHKFHMSIDTGFEMNDDGGESYRTALMVDLDLNENPDD